MSTIVSSPVIHNSNLLSVTEGVLMPEWRTELSNAKRFIRLHGDRIRFIPRWGKWLVWDDRRWALDTGVAVEGLAKGVAEEVWQEVTTELPRSSGHSEMGKLTSFAAATASAKGITNFIKLARSEPNVLVEHTQLDQNGMALNVLNGTLDLTTGNRRDHNKLDLMTALAPVVYDPQATCPLWLQFLGEIMCNDAGLVEFLQRLAGYWLTGCVNDHVMPIFHGVGGNGKGVFLRTLAAMMGPDYAMEAPHEFLLAKKHPTHLTEQAALFGKRLVCCNEVDKGRQMAESLMKKLTGGDAMRVRRTYEDTWELSPTHKIVLSCNSKPKIDGADNGNRRRIRVVPFNFVIPQGQADTGLEERLRGELSGILNWVIRGCLAWQTNGLTSPQAVVDATRKYINENDTLGEFVSERCIRADHLSIGVTKLWQEYEKWCHHEGKEAVDRSDFADQLTAQGIEAGRFTGGPDKGRKSRKGIGLRPSEASEASSVSPLRACA